MEGTKVASKSSGILVLAGTILAAFANWYLVFLFARTGGGAEAVGEYASIIAVATPIFVACSLGLRTILVSHRTAFSWKVYELLRAIGLTVGAVLLMSWVIVTDSVSVTLGLSILCFKLVTAVENIFEARVQYSGQMRVLGSIMITNGTLTIVLSTVAVVLTGRIELGVLAAALANVVGAIWSKRVSRNIRPDSVEFTWGQVREVLKAAAPITVSQFFASLLFQIPIYLISTQGNNHLVGLYTSTAYLITVANLIGSTLQITLITPLRVVLHDSGVGAVQDKIYSVARRVLMLAVPASAIVVALGDFLFSWIYGSGFEIGHLSLLFLAIACTFTILSFLLSVGLDVVNSYSRVTASMAFSCAVSLITGVLLLDYWNDAVLCGFVMASAGALARTFSLFSALRTEVRRS